MSEAGPRSFSAIGRYEIIELVGAGSMGNVYKAFDSALNRLVAIKTVRGDLIVDDADTTPFKVRFYREAQILGSLSHPHIVSLYDMGEHEGSPYMVMEYWSRHSLATWLASRRSLGLEEAVELLQPLAKAIDYAHRASVVHLDLKPSNILLDDAGKCPKVTDFGVAKIVGNGLDSSLGLFGTPGYMSPEQVRSETPSHHSDLFSLAVVAFEMLSGERPFPGASVEAVLYRIAHGEPVLPFSLAALGWAEPEWRRLFSKALAKDPCERFDSAMELVEELGTLEPKRAIAFSSLPSGAASSASTGAPATVHLPASRLPARFPRRFLVPALCAAGVPLFALVWLGMSSAPVPKALSLDVGDSRAAAASSTTGRRVEDSHEGAGTENVFATSLSGGDSASPPISNASALVPEPPPSAPVSRVSLSASVRLGEGVLVVENRDAFDWTNVELGLGERRAALQLGKLKAGKLYSLPLEGSVATSSNGTEPAHQDVTILCETPMGEGWYSMRTLVSR